MKAISLEIEEVFLIEPTVFKDDRGFFFESFNKLKFEKLINKEVDFVQDNHSKSSLGVLRGLHYQLPPMGQGKLVRVTEGEIFDVAVDIRRNSKTFGKWTGEKLSEKNKKQLWIPEGFAHGFLTLSESAQVLYKTTNYYDPKYERSIIWNDKYININWSNLYKGKIKISDKDKEGKLLSKSDIFD